MSSSSNKAPTIRPDFDTDVLWKPIRLGGRQRTVSVDSTESGESAGYRRVSVSEMSNSSQSSPQEAGPEGRGRKLSFTEMIFGSPKGGFSWGQANLPSHPQAPETSKSVTDDQRFKELLKHQQVILNDEMGGGTTFSRKDYMKS